LTKENKVLRKYLLDQTRYLQQVSALFEKIPSLEKLPHHNMEIVNTISYIRLNSFNEIMLTRPKKADLEPDRLYGLIQNDVVGGTAILRGDHLYGYLTSNPRCRFGVFVGPDRSPGIAEGLDKDTMIIKFIPKWAKIRIGDKVETSGLDGIFFANVPVGTVKKVQIENSYKTAYIKTYNDTLHPDYFFLITDTVPYLTSSYDKDDTHLEEANTTLRPVTPEARISSIPEAVQTQDNTVDPSEFEIPKEEEPIKPPVVLKHPKPKPKKRTPPAPKPTTTAPRQPSTQEGTQTPPTPPQPPKPKRRSPMDILNGR
jgi:rod shape-determining protein MreC